MSITDERPAAPDELRQRVAEELESWEEDELAAFLERRGESKEHFLTGARRPVERVYGPEHLAGRAGTRSACPAGSRTRAGRTRRCTARPWTMRQIAGFGRPRRPTSASST